LIAANIADAMGSEYNQKTSKLRIKIQSKWVGEHHQQDNHITFSTVIYRPSRTDWLRYFTQRLAPSTLSIVTKANPREMRVRGSTTRKQEAT